MSTTLKQKIEKRKKEAERKNISGLAHDIARLGSVSSGHDGKGTEWTTRSYHGDELLIVDTRESYEDGDGGGYSSSSLVIEYKGAQVFDIRYAGIIAYIPGKWERLLPGLLIKAKEAAKEREKDERRQEKEKSEAAVREEAKKFGL